MRVHSADRDRLDSLASYDVVGAGPLVELDGVTSLAAEALGMPMAAVTVVDTDTQWCTSLHGADLRRTRHLRRQVLLIDGNAAGRRE